MDDILDRVRERIGSAPKDPFGNTRAPAPTATYAGIAADEQALGFALPPLLKRLYVKVGNGGWGPGYGLLGLTGGAKDDLGQTAVQGYLSKRVWSPSDEPGWRWPAGLLPLCHWGCAIYSCIDCTKPTFPVVAFDPNGRDAYSSWSEALFPECDGFDHWIALWALGRDMWERLYGDGGVIEEAHYARSVEELTRHAAADFRRCAGSQQEQRAALCRYLRRGADEDFTTGELVDFLGVSSPSVLDMAGYSEKAAGHVMKMLADITDEEIQRTTL
jgi:hypothetical protein